MNIDKFEEAYIRSNAQLAFAIAEAISGKNIAAAAAARHGSTERPTPDDGRIIRTKKGTIVADLPGGVGVSKRRRRGGPDNFRFYGNPEK